MTQKPITPEAAERVGSPVADADSSVARPNAADASPAASAPNTRSASDILTAAKVATPNAATDAAASANATSPNTAKANAASPNNAIKNAASADDAAADEIPEPPLLVWPPPEEDLADWHVIPLLRPDPKPVAPLSAIDAALPPPAPRPAAEPPAASTTVNLVDAGAAANRPKRTPPAWLINHKRVNVDGSPTDSTDAPSPLSGSPRADAGDIDVTPRAPHGASPGAHASGAGLPHVEPPRGARAPHDASTGPRPSIAAPPHGEPPRGAARTPVDAAGVPHKEPIKTATPPRPTLTAVPSAMTLNQPLADHAPLVPVRPTTPTPPGQTRRASDVPPDAAKSARPTATPAGHAPPQAHSPSSASLSTSPLALDRLEHARSITHAPTTARGVGGSVGAARPASSGPAQRVAVIVLALLAVGQAAYIGARLLLTPAQAAPASILIVHSEPTGADVFIDGQRRGETPFRADVPPGEHTLELRKNGRVRTIPLVLAAGVQSAQYVEMGGPTVPSSRGDASSPSATPPSSAPDRNRPDRAAIATASNPTPPPPKGASSESTSAPAASSAGEGPAPSATSAPSAPAASTPSSSPAAVEPAAAPPPPVTPPVTPPVAPMGRSGLVVESPLNLTILRKGEVLGNSDEGRIALGAGSHELELRNDTVGYRAVMSVDIPRGRVVTLPVELPQSTLDISATPSARVWIDGRTVGTAPINQIALPVGTHEVRFEHPDYGERRVTVTVRVGATAHASVDFTKP